MTTTLKAPPLLVTALLLAGGSAPLQAQIQEDTRVEVRVLARNAKLIGDAVGGVRVTVVHAETGDTLGSGVTAGATGDTGLIMNEGRERGRTIFGTPDAAGWTAVLPLRRPTPVEIIAEGPIGFPTVPARASKTLLLVPGADLVGEGVVLELNGLIVELLDPTPRTAKLSLPVRARVRMLCSCPTEPDGLWPVETVRARLLEDDEVVAEAELRFSGETSVYVGEIEAPRAGRYELEVVAADAPSANFGRESVTVELGAGDAPPPARPLS